MSETDTPVVDTPPAATPDAPTKDDSPQTVPVAELARERKARKDAEKRLEQLEKDAEDRRKAEMSEAERFKAEAETAKQRAVELERTLQSRDRESWLRKAAQAAGFIDPEDAVARIGTADVEDERAAKDAVKDLAAKAKHLVAKSDDKPDLRKVLRNGEPTPDGADGGDKPPKYTLDDIKAMSPEQIRADLEEVNRSLAAHAAA